MEIKRIGQKRKGFTLTEIMVVVGVLGIFVLIVYNLFSMINRSSVIVEWRAATNSQLTRAFAILQEDLSRANYPSVITRNFVYQNPQALGGGLYRQIEPTASNNLRIFRSEGTSEVIRLPEAATEITIMSWQIHTPEVQIHNTDIETKICTLTWHKVYQGRYNVLTYKVQAPSQYNMIPYGNSRLIPNNTEIVMVDNVDFIKITTTPKYSPEQIRSFNEIKSNPGNYLDPSAKEYFHDWMNPHVLVFEIEVAEDVRISSILGRRQNRFSVSGKFVVDPLSVIPMKVANF
ncbi:MAG: prepilin-type N-terminal cleavage/methylation domain-containing protein [Candidatus Muiribacteriota bacterium]